MVLSDFGLPPLASGQFITNMQLRMSFAAMELSASSSHPSIDVEYSFGNGWQDAGSIVIDGEVSNALNGGYFLFALPLIRNVKDLDTLSVRISYHGTDAQVQHMYLDSAWVELATETYDKALLDARDAPDQLAKLHKPHLLSLLSSQLDFTRDERPTFSLRYQSQRNVVVQLVRSLFGKQLATVDSVTVRHEGLGDIGISPQIDVTKDGLITIQLTDADKAKLRPGMYTVDLEMNEGGVDFTDSFDFEWGLLSLNTNQSEYAPGDIADVSLGALTPDGNTLCDANLNLYVIDPTGYISRSPVTPSGQCTGNNVTDVPDYTAQLTTTVPGVYQLYVERVDEQGNVLAHTSDTFNVAPHAPLVVSRVGPTRIYPPSPYPMNITVTANQAWSGTLTEVVPEGFVISDTDATVRATNGQQELSWSVDLQKGQSQTFSYSFDAPDLSPYLYTLGPARLEGDASTVSQPPMATSQAATSTGTSSNPELSSVTSSSTASSSAPVHANATQAQPSGPVSFTEFRKWQIASDATGNMVLFWDDGASIPAGWTCVSCNATSTFYQRFIEGSSTYNNTGGRATSTHTAVGTVLTSTSASTEGGSGAIAPVSHTHTLTPVISVASNLPQYRQLRVIEYTASAGEPATIPAGAIGVFDVASSSLPTGWTRYAAQDGDYVRGENTPASTGGSNTHTHTVTGTTSPASGSGTRVRGPVAAYGAPDTHTHTISTTTDTVNNEPPYVTVLLGMAGGTAAPPNDLIAMWTDSVPSGWVDESSNPGDPFNSKFIKPGTTYGTTGGHETHTHADINGIVSSPPLEAGTGGRSGSSGASDTHTHVVNVTGFSTESNIPPYVTVIFGKRSSNNPVYKQLSYRWYVNEAAQTPTDPWPSGGTDLAEHEPITATSTPVKNGEQLRLRLNTIITNATSTVASSTFKLQYATSSSASTCSTASTWSDVGSATSSAVWRGYDNSGVSDHSTLASTTLASTTLAETYEENGYTGTLPSQIPPGGVSEWDYVLEHNGADAGTTYCFRMVKSDGSTFSTYAEYPSLVTNSAPVSPTPSKLFDNEKTASTSPWFEFVSSDAESEELTYQIEVSTDYGFGSTIIDKNSASNGTQFTNLVTPADKDPYNSGELIRFKSNTSLTNGTTYWWRVRAKDPSGSNAWGDWSTRRSFTIDTSLSVSAWFQTTDEQFETDTLGSATTSSGDVIVGSGVSGLSILDSFTTGNTKTISSGSNRLLLVGIGSDDSSTHVDVNTVSYGGRTLTEVRDEQIGTGYSNGMWVGYLDEAGIEAASGTAITATWNGGTPDTAVLYSSVVLQDVDQDNPIRAFSQNSGTNIATITPTSTVSVVNGGASIYFNVSGQAGETHTPASGYTEGTEQDYGTTPGAVLADAYKLITANGTEQPVADWTNAQNRLAMVEVSVNPYQGTVTGSAITFDDGALGTAWGSLSWNDDQTNGSIDYQIEYYDSTNGWTLIPDSDLVGNSSGFTSSPVSLLDLDTGTYNEIRVVANLTYQGGSPALHDWTVEWGYRVETPTITKLFPNEKTGTTSPTFEFSTTDPLGNDLTYQISWSTDDTFTSSTTRTSDSDPGFVNADFGGDLDPFTSGDTIQFTVQPSDALTDGATYWWRVRAKSATTSGAYSLWTTKQSFTVSTTTTVSTWFQTTKEQFNTDVLSGTESLNSDALSVATTARTAMLVYGKGVETAPKYRLWDGSSWGSEYDTQDIGAPTKWAVVKAGTTREEYVAGTIGTDAHVNLQVYQNGAWGDLKLASTNLGNVNARGLDIAYETKSGRALAVYCNNGPDPEYYIWNGSSWTYGGTITVASANNCEWIKLASNPTNNEIIMLERDSVGTANNSYEAQVWNATTSTWANATNQGSSRGSAYESMTLGYEESANQALIVTADGNPVRFRYDSWNGTAWAGSATNNTITDNLIWTELVPDNGTDAMAMCYIDESSDIGVIRWTGSAWTGQTNLSTAGTSIAGRPVSCTFESTTGRDGYIMVPYSDGTAARYQSFNGAAWSGESTISGIGSSVDVQTIRTGDGVILADFFDAANDRLLGTSWDGSNWTTPTTLNTNMSVDTTPYGEPFSMAPRNSGKNGTTIVSPGINFTDGTGPYWKQMYWSDVTPGTSQILYSVQYYDSGASAWEFIPDADLPGNSTGTSTSPIDLSSLNKDTYSEIRPYASLSCDGSNNCPQLLDWSVEWAGGITVSGSLKTYDQTSNINSGTVDVAVNGTLQVGKTGSVSGGAWSIDNVTVFPGDVVTVFLATSTEQSKAAAVTRYDGSGDITGMQMYQMHLALGSDDATSTPLTNEDIGLYDNTNNTNLFYNATGTTLGVCAETGCGDVELYINASTTYQPNGTLTTGGIEVNGTFKPGGSTIYVGHSWDNNGTVTAATSTIIFTATSTTESLDETGASSPSFYNLTFGNTSSSATWDLVAGLDVNNNLSVSYGTLARGSLPITVAGSLFTGASGYWSGVGTTTFDGSGSKSWANSNATPQNIGYAVIDGTSKTVTLAGNVAAQSVTVGSDDILDVTTGNYAITDYGDWTIGNTFAARFGTVYFAATTTNHTITSGGNSFYNVNFTGTGGSWAFSAANLTVGNDLTIATGTVTMPTGTTTLAGSFSSVGGTFLHNNALINFTSSGAETISASGTPFTNAFYNLRFSGSGSWYFLDTNATTSNDMLITAGTVSMPSGTMTIGGSFLNTAGTFAHHSGTLKFTSAATESIDTNASFNSLLFAGSGSWSFVDPSVTALGNLTVSGGTLTLPTTQLTLGGSLTNTVTLTAGSGTVLMNSTDAGETIDLGGSSLHNLTFQSSTGGWTIVGDATTTNNFTITSASSFTASSGVLVSVGGTFTNSVGGASTTWTGSTLSLEAGAYTMNTKTAGGDQYDTLRIKANTHIKMWDSSALTYVIDPSGSLYSMDHAGVDGDLYIFGSYLRTSGTEYWNYATDFDGTALNASTSRQVNVKFASGASADFSGSTLDVVGVGSASTSIANQGSGTYTISVSSGTTTMNYYAFADLGASGLSLSGTTSVASLSYGAFTPATAGGTGITVSSTTIDANPALQIQHVNFATTTAIAAYNVSETDGTPSSFWWFRNSTGNLEGEAHDNDTGDPGSIRWDDSSLIISVSGTVYQSDEVTPMGAPTCDGSNPVVRVVVSGSNASSSSCSAADGSYTVSGLIVTGAPVLTVYLDTNGGAKAVLVTKTPTANLTNIDLYQNRVVTREEDVTPLSIADMAAYDSSDDSDIPFTAATGTMDTLTLPSNTELHIASSTTFAPGGTITINGNGQSNTYDGAIHLDDNSTLEGSATSTYTIAGSFTMDTGATFVPASTTVVMDATTTGKTVTTPAGQTIDFNVLQFAGTSGGWNINGDIQADYGIALDDGTVTGTGDITVVHGSLQGNGTLSLGSGTTTIDRTNTLGGTTPWTFGNLVLGSGTDVGTTTPATNATTTVLGKLTIANAHFLDAVGSHWDLRGAGTAFDETGTFLEGTSTVRYGGTSNEDILSTGYYDLVLDATGGSPTYTADALGIAVANDMTVGTTGTTTADFSAHNSLLDVNGDFTIGAFGTYIGSGSASFTVAGSYANAGTFTASGGTITFDGAGTVSIDPGSSSFYDAIINGTGDFTVSQNATATDAFALTGATTFTLDPGKTLAVGGTFTNGVGGAATTWASSTLYLYGGGNYAINASTTSDTYDTLAVASGTQIRMWNSSASTYDINSSGSLYSMDHGGTNGHLNIYGAYTKSSGTDYWDHARDFDGTVLGGSGRKVDVYFASGASAVYTGGGLQILGDSAASTTLQNQGGGTYSLRIGGTASTSMSYYEVRDTDSNGLTFSGTPHVVTLSYGDFLVNTAGGSGMTVGGTVINANAAKTFTGNIFATSSAISAYNVTATGTSVSSWRFTNHTGNLAGEAFDVDPGGDPGYIVWDDSAGTITISGHVYSDEGSTVSSVCDGSTPNIHLVVAGLTTATSTCDGSGLYSISGIHASSSDSVIVYISGESVHGAAVTVDPISSIGDMDIYENRVIVRHENTDPITIADMAVYDSSNDADIPFTANTGSPDTLSLPSNYKLIVWTGKEFAPGGNVTVTGGGGGSAYDGTLEVYANGAFTAAGSESHTIGGSLILDSGATLTDAASTFTFTTAGSARTIDTNNDSFYNLVLSGSGSWNVTNTTLTVANDLTITQGSLTLPSATTTIGGSLLNTGGSFNANGGTMRFTSSGSKSVEPGGSDFHALTFAGSGSFTFLGANATATADVSIVQGTVVAATGTIAIGGDFVNAATFTHNSGTLRLYATSSSALTAGGSDLGSVTFDGAGPFTMTDTNAALAGSLTIDQGAVTLATGTLSIAGSFNNLGGSFDNATGTVLFDATVPGFTIDPGGSDFYAVQISAPSGGYTITGNATTTGNFSLTNAAAFAVQSGVRLAVEGVFTNNVGGSATTWSGSTLAIDSGSGYTINTKTTGGDQYDTLTVGANTDLRMWNSAATSTVVASSSSLYSMDNAAVDGSLYIYGDYHRTTGTDYWSYATDFDGTDLTGSERAVTVAFASGATSTFSGGTLDVIGASGYETTVTNQGSGTYAMRVTGGTFDAQHYKFRNLDSTGLSLSGTTTVSSLSAGDFELAVNGGSLITLASTTLNYNASLVISGDSFATTTAITGTNVALVGTTTSAWTFTGATGNLAGEYFDSDGGSACGSIRWDDSSCLLTQQSAYRFRSDDGGEGVPDSEWYDTSYTKRKRITLTNSDATTYTDAVVKVTVPYDSDMQTDFDDLRFTDSSGTTTIPYFRETYTASTDAVVWVKVPSLAASGDTNIYMYYGNSLATDGSATSTFPYLDNFEDGNISEYSGDTSLFAVTGSYAYERSYGLDATPNQNAQSTNGLYRTNVTISQGETVRFLQYIDTSAAGSGDETCTLFGVQSVGNNYAVCLEQYGTDRMSISKNVVNTDTSGTVLASTTVSYSTGWYEVEVRWGTDNSISASLYHSGSLVATASATDSSYTSGGMGFTFWYQHGGWDIYSARPLLSTEPSVSFGGEQVSGGASWYAARNAAATGLATGEKVRARFLVENTGLQVSGQQYELEYADKGTAPSCESVSQASYSAVPPIASCGISPLCMATSSNFTNLDPTTDVLGGNGTFTPGAIIQDPSNKSGSTTVNSNEYTELEYDISPTSHATSSAYCLLVSNNGTKLDSYTHVAELGMRFDPTVSTLTLNNGQPISLLPGTTTVVYATGTASDLNGYTDLSHATATIYRTGVGPTCTADDNNCYISTTNSGQCSFTNCSGNSCTVSCTANIYYYADPTDAGTYSGQDWTSYIEVADQSNGIGIGSSGGVELNTLQAITLDTSDIDYGSLSVNSDTGSYNPTTTVENVGNNSIDLDLDGTDLTGGGGSTIPVGEQKFATSSFTYSACTYCTTLSTSSVTYNVNLAKPTTTTPIVTGTVYWGVFVPIGTSGTSHHGTVVFTPTSNTGP